MDKPHQKLIKTRLTRPIRLTIMILLVSSFFVISPLLIAYGSGYRYDFPTKQIKKTGVLNLDIRPINAQAFLNNKKVSATIPFNLSLYPDTYLLTIKKDGYKTWEKSISINSKQTTYINNFMLLKDEHPIFTKEKNVEDIIGSKNSENILLLLKAPNNKYNISIFNLKNNNEDILEQNVTILTYSSSPFNNFAYIIKEENNEKIISLYDLNSPKDFKTNNIDTLNLQWIDNNNRLLGTIEKNNILALDKNLNTKELETVDPSAHWYVDQNEKIWLYEDNIIFADKEKYRLKNTIIKIVDINNKRLIAQTMDSFLVYNFETQKEKRINGKELFFNETNKEWIIYSNWDITSIQKDGVVYLQYRTGEKIKNLQLLDEGKLYIVKTEDELKAIDINQYLQFSLSKNNEEKIYTNKRFKTIFYVTGDEQKLYRLDF